MKVVIFCGGLGTRLREETEFKPKPMVDVGDRPILWHIMKIYASYGFNEFVLCLGYKGEIIKQYFYNYEIMTNDFTVEYKNKVSLKVHHRGIESGWKVTLVDTGKDTLKGARLKRAEPYIDGDSFMLTYGDGVADVNLKKMLSIHKKHKGVGTICGVRPPSRFGEIKTKGQSVLSFTEKPQVSMGLINGGFSIFNKDIFKYLTPDKDCDLEGDVFQALAKQGKLMFYEHAGQWECMDNYRDVEHLNKLWDSGKAFWKNWD